MKKHILFLIITLLFSTYSCYDFLEFDKKGEMNEELAFEPYSRRNILSNIYGDLPRVDNYIDGALLDCATDDAEYVNEYSNIQRFNTGNITVHYNPEDQWRRLYEGIRKCNNFLENATVDRLDEYKYNLDPDRDESEYYPRLLKALEYERAEVRFLRSYFYFELIKRYGGVPILTKSDEVDFESDKHNFSRDSFANCRDFIINELNSIISLLPEVHDTRDGLQGETGRATKGAAMALKARLLIYSASPLFNATNEINLWKKAAVASYDIIESGLYSLENNFADLFTKHDSKEMIFERRQDNSNDFERANFSIGFDGGNTGTCPSQNLVDAFEMVETGLPITDELSGYDPASPYQGRDPRMDATVIYNNSYWFGRQIEVWNGGLDGPPLMNATKTGYYLKKYLNPAVRIGSGQNITQRHTWYLFRLAEIYLNLAEAMNEAYGPDGDPDGIGMTATEAVNIIRNRAGMPNFPSGLTKEQFRSKLQNERRVELAFENHRFWDVRRWKIGPQTLGEQLRGVIIEKVDDTTFNYIPKVVESRVFEDKMYLYPIPYTETVKANLEQNEGW